MSNMFVPEKIIMTNIPNSFLKESIEQEIIGYIDEKNKFCINNFNFNMSLDDIKRNRTLFLIENKKIKQLKIIESFKDNFRIIDDRGVYLSCNNNELLNIVKNSKTKDGIITGNFSIIAKNNMMKLIPTESSLFEEADKFTKAIFNSLKEKKKLELYKNYNTKTGKKFIYLGKRKNKDNKDCFVYIRNYDPEYYNFTFEIRSTKIDLIEVVDDYSHKKDIFEKAINNCFNLNEIDYKKSVKFKIELKHLNILFSCFHNLYLRIDKNLIGKNFSEVYLKEGDNYTKINLADSLLKYINKTVSKTNYVGEYYSDRVGEEFLKENDIYIFTKTYYKNGTLCSSFKYEDEDEEVVVMDKFIFVEKLL